MRRTKAESEETRQHILSTARREFAAHGLARTTLKDIAKAAGVSRGAVYWHFANKRQLFREMREQVSLPLFDVIEVADTEGDPINDVERYLRGLVRRVATDVQTRRTLDILSLRCEYVDDLRPELRLHVRRCRELTRKFADLYAQALRAGSLRRDVTPEVAALGTTVLVVGLLRMWLMDGGRASGTAELDALIAHHVAMLRPVRADTR